MFFFISFCTIHDNTNLKFFLIHFILQKAPAIWETKLVYTVDNLICFWYHHGTAG